MKKQLSFFASSIVVCLLSQTISAQVLQGTTTVSGANNMTITVTVNTSTDVVDITCTGPSSQWYGYGFGGASMTNRYTLIVEGSGSITERKLGNHTSGSLLGSSFLASTSSVAGSVRTTTVSRNRVGASADYFTFPNTAGSFTIIWAKGNGSALSQHASNSRGSALISLVDVCNLPITTLPNLTVCNGDSTQIFGQFQNTPGIYMDTLTTPLGCDSIVSQELINTIDTSVTQIPNGLMANQANATYQWIDCAMNTIVQGANMQTLQAPNSSDFRVIISLAGCVDTSDCINVTLFSIDELLLRGVKIYPNPATNYVSVEVQNGGLHQISVFNALGQKLIDELSSEVKTSIEVSSLAVGIYYVEVVQADKVYRQKVIKQ
jgi:hypothetical protein